MKKLSAFVCVSPLLLAVHVQAEDKAYTVDDEGFIRNWLGPASIDLGEHPPTPGKALEKPMFDKEHFTGQNKATPKEGGKVKVGGKELA